MAHDVDQTTTDRRNLGVYRFKTADLQAHAELIRTGMRLHPSPICLVENSDHGPYAEQNNAVAKGTSV